MRPSRGKQFGALQDDLRRAGIFVLGVRDGVLRFLEILVGDSAVGVIDRVAEAYVGGQALRQNPAARSVALRFALRGEQFFIAQQLADFAIRRVAHQRGRCFARSVIEIAALFKRAGAVGMHAGALLQRLLMQSLHFGEGGFVALELLIFFEQRIPIAQAPRENAAASGDRR